jgi:hypothetical protein
MVQSLKIAKKVTAIENKVIQGESYYNLTFTTFIRLGSGVSYINVSIVITSNSQLNLG